MNKELEALDRIFNGMSNNVGYIKHFETIRQALVELEDLRESNKVMRKLLDEAYSKIRESNKEMRKLLDEAYSKIPSIDNCAKGGNKR